MQGLDEAQQQALYAIGHGAYEQGRYADALKMFCLLVACDPLEARYLLALGAAAQELGLYEHALQQYAAAAALQLDSPGPCCMAPSACMRWVVAATPWIRSTWCLSCAARRSVRPCANGPSCCAGAMHVPTETAPCPPSRFQFEEVRYVCFSDFARLFRGRPCL